jgi:hypothetical protein
MPRSTVDSGLPVQDSWQPVRSCIMSVLQRPCDAALETQACLCLVAVIIILNISDKGAVSQLKQLLPPARLLRVLQLLAEEVSQDSSPYEPLPGLFCSRRSVVTLPAHCTC